jgi:hypothetical protein
MNRDSSRISVKPGAKLSDNLSNHINSLNKKQRLANLAKINNLAKMTVKSTNTAYQAAVSRGTKFPIDELQRRVLGKLRKTYSEQAYKDLVINLGYLPAFERLDWLKVMDDKLRRKN